MNQFLPGFDAIPVVDPVPKPKSATQYYLRVQLDNGWHFLWVTHTNGGCEWEHEEELTIKGGRKKPLRYKTYSGATRMLHQYVDVSSKGILACEVAVWHG